MGSSPAELGRPPPGIRWQMHRPLREDPQSPLLSLPPRAGLLLCNMSPVPEALITTASSTFSPSNAIDVLTQAGATIPANKAGNVMNPVTTTTGGPPTMTAAAGGKTGNLFTYVVFGSPLRPLIMRSDNKSLA
jgi:hypothetical protein